MIPRVLSGAVLFLLTLASILYLSQTFFLLVFDVVLLLLFWEFHGLLSRYPASKAPDSGLGGRPGIRAGTGVLGWGCLVLGLLLTWVWVFQPNWVVPYVLCVLLVVMTLSLTVEDVRRRFPLAAGHFLGFCYLGFPVCIAVSYQQKPYELLLILFAVAMADIGAYLVGRRWGRHKMVPRISPKKSWEGFAAGLLGCVLFSLLYGSSFMPHRSPWLLAGIGIALGMVATIGDLFESAIKRGADVKDSGSLIPGHGGLLDRADGLLFALPTYYCISFLLE